MAVIGQKRDEFIVHVAASEPRRQWRHLFIFGNNKAMLIGDQNACKLKFGNDTWLTAVLRPTSEWYCSLIRAGAAASTSSTLAVQEKCRQGA